MRERKRERESSPLFALFAKAEMDFISRCLGIYCLFSTEKLENHTQIEPCRTRTSSYFGLVSCDQSFRSLNAHQTLKELLWKLVESNQFCQDHSCVKLGHMLCVASWDDTTKYDGPSIGRQKQPG
jgi:hypothetical protein